MAVVLKNLWKCASVAVKAAAGLKLLGEKQSKEKYLGRSREQAEEEVRVLLEVGRGVTIMDGEEIYLWWRGARALPALLPWVWVEAGRVDMLLEFLAPEHKDPNKKRVIPNLCLASGTKGDVKIGEGEDQGTFLMDGADIGGPESFAQHVMIKDTCAEFSCFPNCIFIISQGLRGQALLIQRHVSA